MKSKPIKERVKESTIPNLLKMDWIFNKNEVDREQEDQDREDIHDCSRSCGCQDIKIYE